MTGQGSKKILITCGLGVPGEMIAPELVAEGHSVKILTRKTEKIKGKKWTGVEAVGGDVRQREDLLRALDRMDAVCLLGPPFHADPAVEAQLGRTVVEASRESGIRHLVYISVCGADKDTGVPHLETKHGIEELLKSSGLSWTILRPAWYMENFIVPSHFPSLEKGVISTPLRPDRVLELVSASDVGRVAAEAFTLPGMFAEREIDLAADRLTMEEIAGEFSLILSRRIEYRQTPGEESGRALTPEQATMFRWLDERGFQGDILMAEELLKRFRIQPTSFRDFVLDSRGMFPKAA